QTRVRFKSKLHRSTDYFAGLSVAEKCELADRELTETKKEIRRMKEDMEQTLQDLEARIEEADIWSTDAKKATSDFEYFVSTISNKKGTITAPEKLLRYMEKRNRQRGLLAERLRAENFFLKGYKKQLQQQLRQKEQVGEISREVRLQRLQIKNAQYKEIIDNKKQELSHLRLTSGKVFQVLNFYKSKLQDAMETSKSLTKEISQKKELLEKTEREIALVEEQRAEAERKNLRLRKLLSDYNAPPVLSYVQKKMDVAELEKSVKVWERKVAAAEMSLKSYRRAWNQIKKSGNQH
ncbi:CC113 protein, partial [Nyctibius grandis]|nr:CC113 protein [Nyctibius grandis]